MEFKVKYDKTINSGSFSYADKALIIGTKESVWRILEIFIHEVKEAIQCEQSTRYTSYDCDTRYVFMYDHAYHTDLVARLTQAIKEFIV